MTKNIGSYGMIALGAFLFAVGLNFFIVPLGFYGSGFIGIAQIIRTLLQNYFHLSTAYDIAGIITLFISIPLFIWAYRNMPRTFFVRTLFWGMIEAFFMTVMVLTGEPVIENVLIGCLVGGICCGIGIGVSLRGYGDREGINRLGAYFSLKYPSIHARKIRILIHILVVGVCACVFSLPTAIYSAIYMVFMAMTIALGKEAFKLIF